MENREILIANTKTQKRSRLMTDATTLGELKEALDDKGIDYDGMTFTEGISKTQLLDDDTQLPQNIMYKGQPTNNLVILLTNTKKNIASGASGLSRSEVYQLIKDYGLQEVVKNIYHRNFTMVPTKDLMDVIDKHKPTIPQEEQKEMAPESTNEQGLVDNGLCVAILNLIDHLVRRGMLSSQDLQCIVNFMGVRVDEPQVAKVPTSQQPSEVPSLSQPVQTKDAGIDEDDIDDMISDLGL